MGRRIIMAKEKDQTVEKEPQASKGEEKKAKGGKGIILIVLALIVLGAGTFGGTYYYKQKNSSTEITEVKVAILEELTVNLSDVDSKRYIKTAVTISYDKKNKDAAKEITEKTVELQDKTTSYLKSRTPEDFQPKNEEKLKKELVEELNKLLVKGKVINVYFPSGVLIQ